jgi:glycosyltransferase involved in cell wall biosynthesis
MKRVLIVLSSLEYGGAARQATLLAMGLPKDRFQVGVCVLRTLGPWKDDLVKAGVEVTPLGWRRSLDVRSIALLRAFFRATRPDVIHVFGLAALRVVSTARLGLGLRLVVSMAWPASKNQIRMNPVDRWLLRRADRIIAGGPFEMAACRLLRLQERQIVEIAPGADLTIPSTGARSVREPLGLPAHTRLIACVGPIDRDKGFRDAVWAFDILQFLFSDLRLLVVGVGDDLPRVLRFARQARVADRVYFLGAVPDVPAVLSEAEIVWVPSCGNTGVNAILEGMAAGKPVIASSRPLIADVIRHGETAILVPPNDQGELARQTRLLLDDSERCRRLGASARMQVEKRHDAARFAAECARLYQSLGA